MDTSEQPNSICHVQSIHMYPLQPVPVERVPFHLLNGEHVLHSGTIPDGVIVATNFRLFLRTRGKPYHIPCGLIELVEIKELSNLYIGCKDARTYRCKFESGEKCQEWYDRILKAVEIPKQVEQLFAFYHYIWSKEKASEDVIGQMLNQRRYTFDRQSFESEMNRLQFQGHSWRISKVNEDYQFCPTYPPYLLVPSCINDDILDSVANFRSSRRIPAVVWRHARNGAVIVRCSQPEVGWLYWRNTEDEDLIKAISDACSFDHTFRTAERDSNLSTSPGSVQSDDSLQIMNTIGVAQKKFLIMDARSFTTAMANRARGGGCECPQYYPNCEIQFMNLANIHSIRKSFHALRQLCSYSADQANWYSQLEGTRWLSNMSGLLKAAVILVTAVDRDARPVLVHCSDGWDRTPQIVALGELLLDPYYRTVEGFRILIQREWLAFGHKFADRCGHSSGSDVNERCPIFLQWLDCVHQLLIQFPCGFEFSQIYLVKMAQHVYSNLFGTFLCNTQRMRSKIVDGKTFSVWDFLSSPCFRNHLYSASTNKKVLWPQCNVRDLHLWSEVYLGSIEENLGSIEDSVCSDSPRFPPNTRATSPNHMTKTKSYGDLLNNDGEQPSCSYSQRRLSDPNMQRDLKKTTPQDIPSVPNIRNDVLNRLNDEPQNDYSNYLEDNDCNQDCMFKENDASDDQIGDIDQTDFGEPPPTKELAGEEDERVKDCSEIDRFIANVIISDLGRFSSDNGIISEKINDETEKSVLNRNTKRMNVTNGVKDNNGELNGDSSTIVENSLSEMDRSGANSTGTLVGDGKINGHQSSSQQKAKYPNNTKVSSSNNGWDRTLHNVPIVPKNIHSDGYPLGEDGLVTLRSAVQERLDQILDDCNRKVELLEKELHITRQNLIKQSRLRCNHNDCEQDDNNSVVESICSTSEGPASAVESLRSDVSWVAVDEGSSECQTLWVPDHAVSKCTGCSTEFWLGRRRHHCRKCGKIFCADCSEYSTPIPSEQLYNPVRVCTKCYLEIQRNRGEIPNQCKQTNGQHSNASTQIAASSN